MKPFFVLAAAFALLPVLAMAETPFDPGRLDYSVQFNGKRIDWHTFAFFVMPGQAVEIRVLAPDNGPVMIEHGGGLTPIDARRWNWVAPDDAGLSTLRIQPEGHDVMTLNVLTMVPSSQIEDGWLEGYRIGEYPAEPLRGQPIYLPPPGKIEISPDLLDLPISPHFTLGQFLCKQQPAQWPKYMVLREALIDKLEIILAEVNRRGIRTDSFAVLSGHRTPWYNQSIGNGRFSRHIWGGAADIFIDTNGDGRMDDLNSDGKSDILDAEILMSIIEDLDEPRSYEQLNGGLGLYGPRPHRGPFIHVDARGHEARWAVP